MNLNNKVIKVLTPEHGARVIKFFKENGVDTGYLDGSSAENKNCYYIYYGVVNGQFDTYSINYVKLSKVEIIELPEEEVFPQVMEVSDSPEFNNSCHRVVFMKKNSTYIAWVDAETLEEAEKTVNTTNWKYARPIQPKILEITLEEVAKKFGVDSKCIRIKE